MSVPACVLADRTTLEDSARRGAQAITLAHGALMCRLKLLPIRYLLQWRCYQSA